MLKKVSGNKSDLKAFAWRKLQTKLVDSFGKLLPK